MVNVRCPDFDVGAGDLIILLTSLEIAAVADKASGNYSRNLKNKNGEFLVTCYSASS